MDRQFQMVKLQIWPVRLHCMNSRRLPDIRNEKIPLPFVWQMARFLMQKATRAAPMIGYWVSRIKKRTAVFWLWRMNNSSGCRQPAGAVCCRWRSWAAHWLAQALGYLFEWNAADKNYLCVRCGQCRWNKTKNCFIRSKPWLKQFFHQFYSSDFLRLNDASGLFRAASRILASLICV